VLTRHDAPASSNGKCCSCLNLANGVSDDARPFRWRRYALGFQGWFGHWWFNWLERQAVARAPGWMFLPFKIVADQLVNATISNVTCVQIQRSIVPFPNCSPFIHLCLQLHTPVEYDSKLRRCEGLG
jgi:hypothetical protein